MLFIIQPSRLRSAEWVGPRIDCQGGVGAHVFRELLEVSLLLGQLLLELEKLLLLTPPDNEVFVGFLALLECVSV